MQNSGYPSILHIMVINDRKRINVATKNNNQNMFYMFYVITCLIFFVIISLKYLRDQKMLFFFLVYHNFYFVKKCKKTKSKSIFNLLKNIYSKTCAVSINQALTGAALVYT